MRRSEESVGPSVGITTAGLDWSGEAPLKDAVVYLDGVKVWALDLEPGVKPWPSVFLHSLSGNARVAVEDSATGRVWSRDLTFGSGRGRATLTDDLGRPSLLNKWGRLSRPFALRSEQERQVVMNDVARVMSAVESLGHPTFIVGGTLLGAVRSQRLLEHDDDADIAWLSDREHPSDLAQQSFAMERHLKRLGFVVLRHSAAHLQLLFFEAGRPSHYVDIFTAFFKDGEFCEPIHVRSDQLRRTDLVPLSAVTLEGRELPGPADPHAWLAACYGPDWKVPHPGFRFRTPVETVRRFHGWFGALHTHREFWEAYHAEGRSDSRGVPDLASLLGPEEDLLVVDVGCGNGETARVLAADGYDVLALDYVDSALRRVVDPGGPGSIDTAELNLYDRRRVLEMAARLRQDPRRLILLFDFVLDGLTHSGRHNASLLMRWACGPEDKGWIRSRSAPSESYDYDDPTTWHVDPRQVPQTASRYGLTTQSLTSGIGTVEEWLVVNGNEVSHASPG